MKTFKSLLGRTSDTLMAAAAGILVSSTATAQTRNLGKTVIDESKQSMVDLVGSLVSFLQVIAGIGALITLIIVVYKMLKGDREVAEKIAWWVGGLTIGFVLLTVVSDLITRM